MSKIRIRKRGKTYSYSFDIQKSPRRMKEKGGYATEAEAYDAGVAAYNDWKTGNIGITSERIKVKDFLSAWLENVVRPNTKMSTYDNRKSVIRSCIVPYLGDYIVQELRPRDIDAWMRAIARKGLSHGTLQMVKTILSTALKYAVYPAELIASNPALSISVPQAAPRKVCERHIITQTQLSALSNTVYFPVFKLLYHTGLRISEALGLTWDDIDLSTGRTCVIRQLRPKRYFSTPKTLSSKREFFLDSKILSFLKGLHAEQSQNALRLGQVYQLAYEDENHDLSLLPQKTIPPEGWTRRNLLCIKENGVPFSYLAISRNLKKCKLNTHSFRHTHATRLIEAGAKPVDVAARLGHANASITQDLYTHDTDKMKHETALLFARIVDKQV